MIIIVINGFPGAGKDQFVQECKTIRRNIHNVSTVDCVKDLARSCGWDGTKTARNRKFLSDLKQLITEWDDVPYKRVMERIGEIHIRSKMEKEAVEPIVFVHCREPKEIIKFVERAHAYTLYVDRPSAAENVQSNASDSQVTEFQYDFYIDNSGTISYLHEQAKTFLTEFNP